MELLMLILGILITFVCGSLTILMVIGVMLLWSRHKHTKQLDWISSVLDTVVEGNLNENPESSPSTGDLYQSADGKYSANSFEELIRKMADGGDINLDPNDPEILKKFFENINNQDEDDDGEEECKKKS